MTDDVGRADIEAAWARIAPHVRVTPVLEAGPDAFGIDASLALKLELLQHTGSFKPRGAFNKLLASDVPDAGVIAASGGNFGLAVAYAARELGHHAEIFVPDSSPGAKIDRVREQGADVHVIPGFYDEASSAALERVDASGALWMHPFDQPEVVGGGGTVGSEIAVQVPDVDTVVVAIGGGGFVGRTLALALAKLAPQIGYLDAIRAELPEGGILVEEVTQLGCEVERPKRTAAVSGAARRSRAIGHDYGQRAKSGSEQRRRLLAPRGDLRVRRASQ
jgi:threonine dehydratase